jgi:hypothetical protein
MTEVIWIPRRSARQQIVRLVVWTLLALSVAWICASTLGFGGI